MTRLFLLLLATTSPAIGQIAPLSFEAGKQLPLSAGQWTYSQTASGSESRFGSLLAIRCERAARTVVIERVGSPQALLTIATSSAMQSLAAGGRVAATDPLLDAIAFSRGRFLVAGGAAPVLAIPSWPEAARSIEDCR